MYSPNCKVLTIILCIPLIAYLSINSYLVIKLKIRDYIKYIVLIFLRVIEDNYYIYNIYTVITL
jgi:hypothetical protein